MPTGHGYKTLTLRELACLCETARLGSLMAAAAALQLSHPTVWKQVHALERYFGTPLVETHARGCYLTPAGWQLVELAGPSVEQLSQLRERFHAVREAQGVHLTVALTPRMLVEDLAPCIPQFLRQFPKTHFTFLELPNEKVAEAVESRQADFGLCPQPLTKAQQEALLAELAYLLEVRLITSWNHPLAKRRVVRPRDLRPYPLVNDPSSGFFMWNTLAKDLIYLEKVHTVHAGLSVSVLRFVELEVGIGLLPAIPTAPPHPQIHERSMSRYFGMIPVMFLHRRGAFVPPVAEEFKALVYRELGPKAGAPA